MAKLTKQEQAVIKDLEWMVQGVELDYGKIAVGRYTPSDRYRAEVNARAVIYQLIGAKHAMITIAPESRQGIIANEIEQLLDRLLKSGVEI